jgi:hypothetical protein
MAGALLLAAASGGPGLPGQAGAWRAVDEGVGYDAGTIFQYIDGHAEVYLAYGMKTCRARRYVGPEGEGDLLLDLFEMTSPADAYGVFTHDQDGEAVLIGQGALFRYGWLSFWKGRYFVSITAQPDGERARAAALELGRAVAAALAEEGEPPVLVSRLPSQGLVPRSVRYLRHPQVLNAHLFLGDGNPLRLGPQGRLALGRYQRGDQTALLLVAEYADSADAAAAEQALADRFTQSGGPGRAGNGWSAVARMPWGAHAVGLVVEAGSREGAEALLAEARGGRP